MPEFIFTMQEVSRIHPPDKKVLENITLAFYPGAKIGVIGTNGSGKSSLIRIMAGVDTEFMGEAKPYPGTKIGYFAQEPDLGSARTVIDAVNEGVADIRGLISEFEAVSMKLGEPMSDDEMTKVLDKQAALQDKIDALDAWNLDQRLELAMDALRLPPADAEIAKLSGGGKAARRAVSHPALAPGHALARRAHQPFGRRVRGLARALLAGVPRYRGRGDARSLFLGRRGPSGSWSSIAARATRSRATTPRGSSKSRRAWRWRRSKRVLGSAS